jgi:hypothetical protein
MSPKRLNFLKGFAVGAVFYAVITIPYRPIEPNVGAWFDFAVEAALCGALFGAVAVWWGGRGRKAG